MLRTSAALILVLLLAGGTAPTLDTATEGPVFVLGLEGPCDDVVIDADQPILWDAGCTNGEIRPGAWANGCTLNFILSDGTDLYAATAGHCGGVGKTIYVSGVGAIGTIVFREFQPNLGGDWRDWGLIKIDPTKASLVDPTLLRWGGPVAPGGLPLPDGLGLNVRAPLPGEVLLQYGHGQGLGKEDTTKGRPHVVLASIQGAILAVGTVGPGDSGSPARIETGEAAGITSAYAGVTTGDNRGFLDQQCAALNIEDPLCSTLELACQQLDDACDGIWNPGAGIGLLVFTRLDAAVAAFETYLGHDIWVVSGELPGIVVV